MDDKPSTSRGIKRSIPQVHLDEDDVIAAKRPAVTAKPTELDDNKKRWLVVGICFHNIITPALRKYVVPILTALHNELIRNQKIDTQTYPTHLKQYQPTNTSLNYEAVNNNKATYGYQKAKYDYTIKSVVDLSKIFLQTHMAHYTGFDETCDASALLRLISNIDKFPPVVKSDAEDVRRKVRNTWVHCNFTEWDAKNYSTSFQMLKKLVKDLSLSSYEEYQIIGNMKQWEINGLHFLSGTDLGREVVNDFRQQAHDLAKYAKLVVNERDYDYMNIKNVLKNIDNLFQMTETPSVENMETRILEIKKMLSETREYLDKLFADNIRASGFIAKTTTDDVEINGYKGVKNEEKFYQLNIVCDNFVVDCIVDSKLKRRCRKSVKEFQGFKEEMQQWSERHQDFQKKVKEKFQNFVEEQKSCLCQYLLNTLLLKRPSNNAIETHILVKALYSSIENDDVETAKFIGWQIARNFLKTFNLHVFDIWLASVCSCSRLKKKKFSWFCSTNVTIIIIVPHLINESVNIFSGLPIKQILYHCEIFKEAQAISEERTKLLEVELNIECHVPGPLAEKLFNNHRRLTLVCPSEIKSIDFPTVPMFLTRSCIQLYCYVKGAIPIGENHFPVELQGIPTDVIEGFSRFCSNKLRIGDSVTNTRMKGTLGGFCRFYGREAFLTCAHTMMDWDTLLSTGHKHHTQLESVHFNTGDNILNETPLCGKVVNHTFTHHNPKTISTDAAVIELDKDISVSLDDYVNTKGNGLLHYTELGLKSPFLQDGYIQSPKELLGKNINVVCAGAVSGFKDQGSLISEVLEREMKREDVVSASTNLVTSVMKYLRTLLNLPVHMQVFVPNIIHAAKEEEAKSKRTLQFYNQLAVHNIPFEQGDSGACVYITDGKCEKGCLGMAIADYPGGGCIVTPMATLLQKLDLI